MQNQEMEYQKYNTRAPPLILLHPPNNNGMPQSMNNGKMQYHISMHPSTTTPTTKNNQPIWRLSCTVPWQISSLSELMMCVTVDTWPYTS